MTAKPNGNTWDRQTICKMINDHIIASDTWAQIAVLLKKEDVHIRRGLHGSQAKTWTAFSTYEYYRGSPVEMKLDSDDWPTRPKAPKKAGPKKKKKASSMKDISPATKKRVQKKVKEIKKKIKRSKLDDVEEQTGLRTKAIPPASLSVSFENDDADIRLFYRGPSNAVVREVCNELLEIFNRLNDVEGED